MTTQFQKLTKSHRYELVHGDDADFIAINGASAMASGRRFQCG
jgi:hypothetical protein